MSLQCKAWALTEAERYGVREATIYFWRRRGLYDHLTFKKKNPRVVDVEGPVDLPICRLKPGRPRVPPKPRGRDGRPKKFDFSNVDWSKHFNDIAAEMGCHRTLVYHAYRRRKKAVRILILLT